jgi:plastocyanin
MARSLVRRSMVRGALMVVVIAVAACGDDPTDPGPTVTTSVSVEDNKFTPQHIRVSPGATVTWTWTGSNSHNVNFADAGITDGGFRTSGTHNAVMPTTPGTYAYQCDAHSGMTGSVQVQ